MTPVVAIGLALGLAVVVAALSIVLALARRNALRRAGVVVTQFAPDVVMIRTPLGRGVAQVVVHDEHGRVYEVHTHLRGEGPRVTYVPPAAHLVRAHVATRVDDLTARRAATGRSVARLR